MPAGTNYWIAIVQEKTKNTTIHRSVSNIDFPELVDYSDKEKKINDMHTNKTVEYMASKKDAILAINASSCRMDTPLEYNPLTCSNLSVINGKLVCNSDKSIPKEERLDWYYTQDYWDYYKIDTSVPGEIENKINGKLDINVYGNTLCIYNDGHLGLPAYTTNLGALYYQSSDKAKENYKTDFDEIKKTNEKTANDYIPGTNEYQYVTRNYISNLKSENKLPSSTLTASDLVKSGVKETVNFMAIPLVVDGKDTDIDKAKRDANGFGIMELNFHPRTVIAQTKKSDNEPNTYIILVADGRKVPAFSMSHGKNTDINLLPRAKGINLNEAREIIKDRAKKADINKDIQIAYNLDGGGSSTLYFKGKVLNHPSDETSNDGSEVLRSDGANRSLRSVGDMIYFK